MASATQLEFFPSKTLTIYLVRIFALRIAAVLVMLVLVLQMLDLLSESSKILAFPGNSDAQVWHYVSLRAPQLISTSYQAQDLITWTGLIGA